MKHLLLSIILAISSATLFGQNKAIVFTAEPENLGSNINSEVDDTDTRLTPDGKTIYFIRWKSPDNIGGETDQSDIYYAPINADGSFGEAKNIGEPINDPEANMVIGIRPDGNAMITKGQYDEEHHTCVYISHRRGNTWSKPEPMPFDNTEEKILDIGYTVSSDFKHLILVKRGLLEGGNLYVCTMQENGHWSAPEKMGEVINSDKVESWPVLASDGVSLYFSSLGHGGYGSSDIFMSKRLDDSWTNWSEPVNLGEKINTEKYDADFIVDTKGKYAYFSSNKGESFDIYRIELPEEAKPEPMVLVNGRVFNQKTKQPLEVEVIYYLLSTGEELGRAFSNASGGGYKILLPYGKKYSFRATAPKFASISENINLSSSNKELSANQAYQELEYNLYLVPIETGSVVRMNNLFFETGKAELNSDSYLELKHVIEMLNNNPKVEIEIAGHTDNVGSDANNQVLSEQRAKVVANYLINKGIEKSRISYKGYGEKKPIANNNSSNGRQKNRRVEFKILKN